MGMLDSLMREALRKAGEQGGKARASKLAPEERSDLARKAVQARWARVREQAAETPEPVPAPDSLSPSVPSGGTELPLVRLAGTLSILGLSVSCYVLTTGARVIGRTSMTELLTGIDGGGSFEKYLDAGYIKRLISNEEITGRLVDFRMHDVEENGRILRGVPADLVIDVCRAFVAALDQSLRPDGSPLGARRLHMASRAALVLAACAGPGLETLIDEATGYQYERLQEALAIRPRAYLAAELRHWEDIFPDELWIEFARLTGARRGERPRAWSRLLCEMVYEYLDSDLADWLRANRPGERRGQDYHQWLGGQPAARRLVERVWVLIGLARGCATMTELRDRVAGMNGRIPVQFRLYVPIAEGGPPG